MDIVTILWSVGGGVALTLAAVCGLVWLIERRSLAMLMLCVLGVGTAGAAYAELGMLISTTPEEYGAWQKWNHIPLFFAFTSLVLFAHYYLGTGRRWLMLAIIFAQSVVLALNFSVQPNFQFYNIASLRRVPLFGEQVSTIGIATPRGWQWFALASMLLLLTYLIDAAVQAWLNREAGSRRKALVVSLAIVAPLFANLICAQLIVFGVTQGVISSAPWLLGALLVMATELARDFMLSARARLELAELRSSLARVERASVLGQLASAMAHELAQPLHAISLNVAVAGKHLKATEPDIKELQAIFQDLDGDDRRAADIIDRLRRLFPQQRKVETQPLRVEDVLEDVIALIRAEAASKQVAVDLVLQPGLPRVLGDRVHLSQVLLNLVSNGIDAVESRPLDARLIVVEARAAEANGQVEISVRDSGPGIPAEVSDSIFAPYFGTKLESVGMGLAHCRSIIEAQGGRLWADDKTSQEGTVFRLALQRV